MEQQPETTKPEENKCMVCSSPFCEEGYTNKMCAECRTKLSRLEIPQWVKIFSAAVVSLVLIGAVRIPKFLSAGIHYERGINAQNNQKYVTAQHEFTKVASIFPSSTENNARLIICCAHNLDFDGMNDATGRAEGDESEDQGLINEANACIDKMGRYIPDSALTTELGKLNSYPPAAYVDSFKAYITRTQQDDVAKYLLADHLFDINDYHQSDSLLRHILADQPDDMRALSLIAADMREEKEYDTANAYYDKILELNPEVPFAISGKARVEMKRHHDVLALKYANEAMNIDSTDASVLETMAIYNYLNHNKPEAERTLRNMKRIDPDDTALTNYVQNVISNKVSYR